MDQSVSCVSVKYVFYLDYGSVDFISHPAIFMYLTQRIVSFAAVLCTRSRVDVSFICSFINGI